MKWFNKKSNLDEMQELKLLKIESRGFWIGFLGLFLAIAIQVLIYGPENENINHTLGGEFIVFMCMGIYLMGSCLRNGIWDRHLSPTPAVNIGLCLLAAAAAALFNAILSYRNYQNAAAAFAVFIWYFFILGAGLSVTLCICSALYRRKRNRLEDETIDDETDDEN